MGVAAAIEHDRVIANIPLSTLIDVGANKGQFSLTVRARHPDAKIIAFEPLVIPREKFAILFENDVNTTILPFAIGAKRRVTSMHISNSLDSSSLLEISATQNDLFPGTHGVGTEEVQVGKLIDFVEVCTLPRPIFLKIDVQGFEHEVLMGIADSISKIDAIYVECSFIELYLGQKLAHDIFDYLFKLDFEFKGVFNVSYDSEGNAVQGDFLFYNRATHW